MNTRDHLVYMANQIARNFGTMADGDAATATAEHIIRYWDPRMRATLLADGEGLSAVSQAAFEILRERSRAA